MSFNRSLFSSASDRWDTPPDLVADLASVFPWDLDVCAERPNVCDRFYSPADNGLVMPWRGLCWCNPPYGRGIGAWVRRAHDAVYSLPAGDLAVVMLLPARTDPAWWQNFIGGASFVVFIRGRLKFGGSKNSAPFPSAFVVFGKISYVQARKLAAYGWAIDRCGWAD